MADLVDTMTTNNMTRISAEPASPSRWSTKAGGTRLAFPVLMESMSLVDARLSAVTREKGVVNQ